MQQEFRGLLEAVQHNCLIADARHAGDFTLCTYLMKMRELYRWEQRLALDAPLSNDAVGRWVRERERLWEAVEARDYTALPLANRHHDPFDSETVNARLLPAGLVYSAGLGQRSAAHFFLAELEEVRELDGCRVLVAGREYARDLASPPAMTLGETVFVRRETFRRLLWERLQEWRWNRCDTPFGRALAASGAPQDDVEALLDHLVDEQIETVVLHELGEVAAGRGIERDWQALLRGVAGSKAELLARAVRDNLADVLSTLPALLAEGRADRLHFYFSTFSPLRRALYPRLWSAYGEWHAGGGDAALRAAVAAGRDHWRRTVEEALALYAASGARAARPLAELLEAARL